MGVWVKMKSGALFGGSRSILILYLLLRITHAARPEDDPGADRCQKDQEDEDHDAEGTAAVLLQRLGIGGELRFLFHSGRRAIHY